MAPIYAALWLRHLVTSGRLTLDETYAWLANYGFEGGAAEDVLDAAGVTFTPEQISDLDPIVFLAKVF